MHAAHYHHYIIMNRSIIAHISHVSSFILKNADLSVSHICEVSSHKASQSTCGDLMCRDDVFDVAVATQLQSTKASSHVYILFMLRAL